MCLFFHWYGKWQDDPKRIEKRPLITKMHGQIVDIKEEEVRFERRTCHFCGHRQEREKKEIRLW